MMAYARHRLRPGFCPLLTGSCHGSHLVGRATVGTDRRKGRFRMDATQLLPAISRFGYAAALEAELARIGPLSLDEFERRYACSPTQYHARPRWDPASARYWDIFSRDPK